MHASKPDFRIVNLLLGFQKHFDLFLNFPSTFKLWKVPRNSYSIRTCKYEAYIWYISGYGAAARGPTTCMFIKSFFGKNWKSSSKFTIGHGYLVTFYISCFEACLRFRLRRLLSQTCQYPDTYSRTKFSIIEGIEDASWLRTVPLAYERFI